MRSPEDHTERTGLLAGMEPGAQRSGLAAMIRAELRRTAARWRFMLSIGFPAYGLVYAYLHRDGGNGQEPWWYVFQASLAPMAFGLPLFVGLLVGTSMVEERSSTFSRMMLMRIRSRLHYLVGHFLAGSLTLTVVLGIDVTAIGAFAFFVAPRVGSALPLYPKGFPSHPTPLVIAVAAQFVTASIAYLSACLLVTVATTNAYAVVSAPTLLHLGMSVFLPRGFQQWSPISNLASLSSGPPMIHSLVLWAGSAVASMGLAAAVGVRKEVL